MVPRPFCLFETDFGPVGVAWSEHGLTRLQLPEADRSATERRLTRRAADAASARNRLNELARRDPAALQGALGFWLAPQTVESECRADP